MYHDTAITINGRSLTSTGSATALGVCDQDVGMTSRWTRSSTASTPRCESGSNSGDRRNSLRGL